MSKLLQIGIAYPWELSSGIGHVACTLGGVNYESRGGRGILKGSDARSASNGLFKHHFHRVLTNAEAAKAKRYADAQVGEPYVWGGVPGHGGDCSGYISGIICAAEGRSPRRLFGTGTWPTVWRNLGFEQGLRPTGAATADKEEDVPLTNKEITAIAEAVWTRKSPRAGQTYDYLMRRAERATQARDVGFDILSALQAFASEQGVDVDRLGEVMSQALLPALREQVMVSVKTAAAELPDDIAEDIADNVVDQVGARLHPQTNDPS